jgi:hypothetical protein
MNARQQVATLTHASSNRFAGIWLLTLTAILGLTICCTAVLVAWPLVGYISTRLFG